jgi:hypothetical protein
MQQLLCFQVEYVDNAVNGAAGQVLAVVAVRLAHDELAAVLELARLFP